MKGIGEDDGWTDLVLLMEVVDCNVTWHFMKLKYFMRHGRLRLKVRILSVAKPRL